MSREILSWEPPRPGPAVRGTVILLPGRGEHPGVYERFGRRLAFDAYTVHAIAAGAQDDPADLRDEIAALAAASVGPVVLAGSDTGALHALALATEGKLDVEGLLLAATPGAALGKEADESPEWERELELRTGCPTHQARLAEDAAFTRGSLFDPVSERLGAFLDLEDAAYAAVPAHTLVLHGAADRIAPAALAGALAERLPRATLALVREAPHDVLNDASHRSVAGAVVQWLEALRLGTPDELLVTTA